MNNHLSHREVRWQQYQTKEGMAAELIRVDAAINLLLASVGHEPELQQLPSEKLSVYLRAKNAEMRAENMDMGDAMEVISAVAKLAMMFK